MTPDLAVRAALQKLLKPSEEIKWATEVLEAPSTDLPRAVKGARRCLGVISHTNLDLEEGALVVFRRPTSPIILETIPIYADFQIDIQQMETDTAAPRSRILVTFGSPTSDRFSVLADDMTAMHDLIAEIRRLHAVAEKGGWAEGGLTHAWMAEYQPHNDEADAQTLARFDSISSNYSMRISSPTALRAGLGAIDWTNGDVVDSPDLKESEAADQRGRWIVEQLIAREDEFSSKEKIKIWCGTYNVNDTLPKGTDLAPWLADSGAADLLVFGFQEFDLSAEAMVRYTSYREDQWRIAIETSLGKRAPDYEKLHSRQLVGALIVIYVRRECAQHITSVQSNSVATGIMGLMANKGAVAIRLRYKDTWLCFVNSHLAAFTGQVESRNQNVRDTIRYLGFPVKGARDPWLPNLNPHVDRPAGSVGVFDCHHLIWIGDLNYRIDLPRDDVLRMVEKEDWPMLLRFDQLAHQRQAGVAFADFMEAPIAFPPTFKFDVGSDRYDTSEKQRTPSWTDRIQWLSMQSLSTESIAYSSHPSIDLSDHKPVSSLLEVEVATIIPEKRNKVRGEIITELDGYENVAPEVKLLPSPSIEFGSIRYLKPETKSIAVHNTGNVIAQWSFVLRPGTSTLTPAWLTVAPTSGLLLPGEEAEIDFTVLVDDTTAPQLNFALRPEEELSELFILSVLKKDLFISVSARGYERTVFGNSLERLGRLLDPIADIDGAELERIAEDTDSAAEGSEIGERMSVVRPAFRLLEFLMEHGVEDESLFLNSGSPELVEAVRQALDTGGVFPLERLLGAAALRTPPSPPPTEEQLDQLARLQLESEGESDIGAVRLSPEFSRLSLAPPPPGRTASASSIASTSSSKTVTEKDIGVASVAECFLRFLGSLPEPVVTFTAYPRALRAETMEEAYVVVRSLPAIHANLLIYLIGFLKVCIKQSADSKEKAARIARLATVFSAVLLRPSPSAPRDTLSPSSVPRRKQQFVSLLLTEPEPVNLAIGN